MDGLLCVPHAAILRQVGWLVHGIDLIIGKQERCVDHFERLYAAENSIALVLCWMFCFHAHTETESHGILVS